MALFDMMDNELQDSDIKELVGEPLPDVKSYIIDRDVYEVRTYPGTNIRLRYLLHPRGRQITQAEYDYMLASAKDDPAEPETQE